MAVRASDKVTLAVLPAVSYVRPYYLLQASNLAVPAKPTTNPPASPWTISEPDFTMGSTDTLYTTMLIGYGDAYFEYGDVQKSSSYEAAKQAYNQAVTAATQAGQALTSANGKNANWYQNEKPPMTGNTLNDNWFDTDDGNRLYQWNEVDWIPKQFGNNAFSAIDAGKVTTGTLSAARIASRSITVDKLNVGDFTNIAVDPLIESSAGINWTGTNYVRATVSGSTRALATIGNNAAGACHVESMRFYTVDPGATYYLGAELYRTTAGSISLGLQFYDKSKVAIGTPDYCVIDHNTNNWTFRGGLINVPATAVFAKIVGDSVGATSAGNTRWTGFIFRRANTGELIVDGSILARHVEMDTAFADKFWANEGNFGKINVDFLESGVGNTLNIYGNEAINLIVGRQDAQDTTIEFAQQSVDSLSTDVLTMSTRIGEAQAQADVASGAALVAQTTANSVQSNLVAHQSVFKVTETGAVISSTDGSQELRMLPGNIALAQNGVEVSRWEAGRMIVNEMVVNRAQIGSHSFEKYSSGRTIVRPI